MYVVIQWRYSGSTGEMCWLNEDLGLNGEWWLSGCHICCGSVEDGSVGVMCGLNVGDVEVE
jgi:hypothetical protein